MISQFLVARLDRLGYKIDAISQEQFLLLRLIDVVLWDPQGLPKNIARIGHVAMVGSVIMWFTNGVAMALIVFAFGLILVFIASLIHERNIKCSIEEILGKP